ncbi:hypothetical protein [Facklamia sp. P12950]|uniref:hypothetical protein n=1 Tax=Facklamia sp. P12950 TaxID=3421951 RepID=UPI003D169653
MKKLLSLLFVATIFFSLLLKVNAMTIDEYSDLNTEEATLTLIFADTLSDEFWFNYEKETRTFNFVSTTPDLYNAEKDKIVNDFIELSQYISEELSGGFTLNVYDPINLDEPFSVIVDGEKVISKSLNTASKDATVDTVYGKINKSDKTKLNDNLYKDESVLFNLIEDDVISQIEIQFPEFHPNINLDKDFLDSHMFSYMEEDTELVSNKSETEKIYKSKLIDKLYIVSYKLDENGDVISLIINKNF